MQWTDEGYLLSKFNFGENSIIIEAFTLNHGKYTGIVYGGTSRKQKQIFQTGNKIYLNWKSKSENKFGYFTVELVKPITPLYFDDKKKSACILSASSILKILLPERQINKRIYSSFESFLNELKFDNWINLYIFWELSLIKELGFELDYLETLNSKKPNNLTIEINDKLFKLPNLLVTKDMKNNYNNDISEALVFNRNLLMENFIIPNNLQFPLYRSILESYYSN